MELSLSCSYSLEFSPLRPHHNSSTQKQKTTIKPMGRYTCLSTKFFRSPQAIKLNSHVSYSKLGPNKSRGFKAVPLIRTHTQSGGDKLTDSPLEKVSSFSHLLLRLLRGYGLRATVISFISVAARTWIENADVLNLKWSLPIRALAALVAIVCTDVHIAGTNDIFDLEIDKINKPYLTIASGDMSLQFAWFLVISFVAIGVLMTVLLNSVPFLASLCLTIFSNSIYSIPPFRTKNSTIGAILSCGWGRGCCFTLLLTTAARATLGLPFQWSSSMTFMSIFATMFSLAIGIIKDLPDLEGDVIFNVPTLASIIGARNTVFLGSGLILLAYVSSILAAIFMPQNFRRSIMIPAHVLLALSFLFQAWKLDTTNYSKEECVTFYRLVWIHLDIEYIIFPFI